MCIKINISFKTNTFTDNMRLAIIIVILISINKTIQILYLLAIVYWKFI